MDWAAISSMVTRLDTLDPDELALELRRLQGDDPTLSAKLASIRARGQDAHSFMQTRMPDLAAGQRSILEPGDKVGIWEVDVRIGAGGMGEVYKAHRADGLFEQGVALKLARDSDPRLVQRFEAERNRLAQLEHPNIARIVDGGTTNGGLPYLTMEFVDGVPIDVHVKSAQLNRKARLALTLRLLAALAHAHGRLVLHRDIKADNVLINDEGEVRLIDFGVASLLDDPEEQEGRGPLTIAYAAPEQLDGNSVSAATDIFAIGMLIHLLETGRLPQRESDGGVAIDAGLVGDPDLSAILEKATARQPVQRYGSADAFGDDLERFIRGLPVSARPVSTITRLKKLVRRNTLASAMSGAAMVAILAGIIGVSLFAVRADEARDEAELRAEAAEFFVQETEYANQIARVSGNISQEFMAEDQGVDEADFRAFLIEKATEAQSVYAENPEAFSAQMLFVARYLSNRGNYAQSSEFAGFLIANGQTPEVGVQTGRVIQARNLRELGDRRAAEEILRDTLAWMAAKPYLLESSGYAQVAVNLALSTQDKADLDEAVRANLEQATKPGADKALRAYNYNTLAVLTSKIQDYEKTIEYGIKSVEFSKEADRINAVSVNTRSLNLVGYILHYKKDVALAKSYWPSEEDVMDPEKGHLRHRSMHRLYEAYALQIQGDHAAAYEKAKLAHELGVEEYPPGSPYYLSTAGMLIETGALAGANEEVRPLLESITTPDESEDGKPHPRAMIARAFWLDSEGRREEALSEYRSLDQGRIAGNLELTYNAELLKSTLGVV
ncbi:MAG: serine/threonine-protein kinase [Pseudomonadota bacterium]